MRFNSKEELVDFLKCLKETNIESRQKAKDPKSEEYWRGCIDTITAVVILIEECLQCCA